MYVVLEIDDVKTNNIFYQEKVKNTVMDNSNFLRVNYSNELFILNGIYLAVIMNQLSVERYFNKYKCAFDIANNMETIYRIKHIEETILSKIKINGKMPQYKVYEQIRNGNIKVFADNIDDVTNKFLLKIAGIWETDYSYGLTYKFVKL